MAELPGRLGRLLMWLLGLQPDRATSNIDVPGRSTLCHLDDTAASPFAVRSCIAAKRGLSFTFEWETS